MPLYCEMRGAVKTTRVPLPCSDWIIRCPPKCLILSRMLKRPKPPLLTSVRNACRLSNPLPSSMISIRTFCLPPETLTRALPAPACFTTFIRISRVAWKRRTWISCCKGVNPFVALNSILIPCWFSICSVSHSIAGMNPSSFSTGGLISAMINLAWVMDWDMKSCNSLKVL